MILSENSGKILKKIGLGKFFLTNFELVPHCANFGRFDVFVKFSRLIIFPELFHVFFNPLVVRLFYERLKISVENSSSVCMPRQNSSFGSVFLLFHNCRRMFCPIGTRQQSELKYIQYIYIYNNFMHKGRHKTYLVDCFLHLFICTQNYHIEQQ